MGIGHHLYQGWADMALRSGIFEYIESCYNRSRRHSAIGYVSPHDYEQQFEQLTVSTFRG